MALGVNAMTAVTANVRSSYERIPPASRIVGAKSLSAHDS